MRVSEAGGRAIWEWDPESGVFFGSPSVEDPTPQSRLGIEVSHPAMDGFGVSVVVQVRDG